jgi:hypothetical protein
MLLTVPDPGLYAVLASPSLLSQAWPGCEREVMTLIHVLRIAEPSLMEALAIGLVAMLTPARNTGSSLLGLTYKRAGLFAVARNYDSGKRVASPHTRPAEVTMLEVQDVAVEGRSAPRKQLG